jgi:hypothetical protein
MISIKSQFCQGLLSRRFNYLKVNYCSVFSLQKRKWEESLGQSEEEGKNKYRQLTISERLQNLARRAYKRTHRYRHQMACVQILVRYTSKGQHAKVTSLLKPAHVASNQIKNSILGKMINNATQNSRRPTSVVNITDS